MAPRIRYHSNKISIISSGESDDGVSASVDASMGKHEKALASESKYILGLPLLLLLVGGIAAGMFLAFGIAATNSENKGSFHHLSEELTMQILATWDDFETASTWLHLAATAGFANRGSLTTLYRHMITTIDVQVSRKCYVVPQVCA